jgi:hypothetical protein
VLTQDFSIFWKEHLHPGKHTKPLIERARATLAQMGIDFSDIEEKQKLNIEPWDETNEWLIDTEMMQVNQTDTTAKEALQENIHFNDKLATIDLQKMIKKTKKSSKTTQKIK